MAFITRRRLLFVAYAVLVSYSVAAIEGYALPPLAGTPPNGPRSMHAYWPPTTGVYLGGNLSNFKELNVNMTIYPGQRVQEGMLVNLTSFGIVSATVAQGLDGVSVDFLGAKAPNGTQRIVQGSSGWGLTLRPDKNIGGYQIPFLVAGSQGLVGNDTTMEWPAGTGGVDYHPIIVAQYSNGTELQISTNDFIHVYSVADIQSEFRNNAAFVIAVASGIGALIGGLYRFTGPKKDGVI